MDVSNYKKTFNNDTYEMMYFIRNNDISMTSPELIQSDDVMATIPSDLVLYFMVENSMTKFIPTATFEITDDNHCITNRLKAQNTRISVNISKNAGEERLSLTLTFLVKNYTVISFTENSIIYRIFGELDNSVPLNTLCEYATSCDLETDNEMMENPYEIAKSILQQVGYKTFPTEKISASGKKIPTKYSLPATNELCHFITYPNMTAMNAIRYLFSYAVGESGVGSPAYLIHSLYHNKAYITTCEDIWKPSSIDEQPKSTQFSFSMSQPPLPGKQFIMTDVKNNIDTGGILAANLFFNYKFFEYDQETRMWENYNINKIALDDCLTKGINHATQMSLFLRAVKEDFEQSLHYDYVPHKQQVLYDVMRQLELYSSNIVFTVDGDLRFDVGQVINIGERGTNDARIEQFDGQWMITKIQHSFRNKEYKCHLICSRRFNTRLKTGNV